MLTIADLPKGLKLVSGRVQRDDTQKRLKLATSAGCAR